MDRRGFLIGSAALASLAGAARAATDDLKSAARDGWVYGLPIMEMARLRAAAIGDRPGPGTPGYNSFYHSRERASPADRVMSAPEADVLYSSAWIDLSADGARIDLPPTGGRYVCFTLFDMYGNAIETIEGKEIGARGHSIEIAGPAARVGAYGYSAPVPRMPHMGPTVRAPGRWVWALARIHIERDTDLTAVHALQDGFAVRAKPKAGRPAPAAPEGAGWSDYFFALQNLIVENPPPPDEADFFQRIAPLQVGMADGFERARFADEDLPALAAGVEEGRRLVAQKRAADAAGGWVWPKADVGDYGQDFLYRAQTVLAQPGSPPASAIWSLRATGPDSALTFPSDRHWRVTLPSPPPAAGFWSLTLYEPTSEGRLFLTENPTGRHALGAWTPGLQKEADGSIEVWIGHGDPGGRHTANWLPAPASGPFALILRGYGPEFALTERRYKPTPVEALGPEPRKS
ncbi:MAG TPA: DUF1254 domain-containing protein [Caulobacteraceae bacterium]|nr:DUF1254 domain-containing protein [Caulobacteraceae bacterium]